MYFSSDSVPNQIEKEICRKYKNKDPDQFLSYCDLVADKGLVFKEIFHW